ncbi:hypothetical protein VTJ49DRAFT_7531 [Mycothermus thermophilus]|uniref:Uncharacterized protein n=1 Tax=Humicola insolens TaxID=85995 RepID=A0ABR3VI26_HUMIN
MSSASNRQQIRECSQAMCWIQHCQKPPAYGTGSHVQTAEAKHHHIPEPLATTSDSKDKDGQENSEKVRDTGCGITNLDGGEDKKALSSIVTHTGSTEDGDPEQESELEYVRNGESPPPRSMSASSVDSDTNVERRMEDGRRNQRKTRLWAQDQILGSGTWTHLRAFLCGRD